MLDLLDSLGIGTTLECFQSLGSFPRLRDRLNKEAIDGAASSANVLSIQAEMASQPVAEWGLIL